MNSTLNKEAYAYGVSLALQELGYSEQHAQVEGLKIASQKVAEEEEWPMPAEPLRRSNPVLNTLLGVGAGTLGGAALGAGSAFIPGLRGKGLTNLLGKSDTLERGMYRIIPQKLFAHDLLGKGGKWSGIEAYLRGLGGAGIGALGGGLAGSRISNE
jgi:hypothetical protein